MVANDMTRGVLLVALAELGACSPSTLERMGKALELQRGDLAQSPDAHDALDALVSILHAIAAARPSVRTCQNDGGSHGSKPR